MEPENKEKLTSEIAKTITQFKKLNKPSISNDGLRHSEFMLLGSLKECLGASPNGVKASELSNRMEITPAAVTHMINSLEDGGYLERISDPKDRRVVLIAITEKGEEKMEIKKKEFFSSLAGIVEYIGEEDSKELIRILTKTFNYIKEKRNKE